MKKKSKAILLMAGLVAVPAAINYCIAQQAKVKSRRKVQESFYDWRFGKVRYIVAGKGEPLLLVHGVGVGASLGEWEKNIHSLAAHYQVYALDLLGFGNSEKPETTYSAYLYVTLINDFIKQVIGKKTNIIASSNAGAFAVMAYRFKPGLFIKMLLISPTGCMGEQQKRSSFATSPGCMGEQQKRSSFATSPGCRFWFRHFVELPVLGTSFYNALSSKAYCTWFLKEKCYGNPANVTKDVVDTYYDNAHGGGTGAKYPIAAFLGGLLDVDIKTALRRIKIPTAVIWGADNSLNPVSNYKSIQEANPNIPLTLFTDTKLLPHVEKPKAFYKVCRQFFGQGTGSLKN